MEECSSDYQRWTKLPVLKSGDDDGNATLFELRPSLSSHSHTIHQVHGVCDWQMVQTEWALLLYKQHPRRWERHTSILLPCIAIISLSLSLSEQKNKKMVGTDLRQQLNNYIQSMRDQVSSDQTQFFCF